MSFLRPILQPVVMPVLDRTIGRLRAGGGGGATTDEEGKLMRFFSLGDSISADGGRIISDATGPNPYFYQYSWQKYALLSSAGGWDFGGTFGAGGKTIAQLKNDYLPILLSYAQPGDRVIVLMGQNDLGGVTTQTIADYRSVVQQIRARGIIPILGTLTPGASTRTWHVLNSLVLRIANEQGLDVIDFHAAVVNPATGSWQAALARDAVHPNQAGAKVMGLAAGAVLQAIRGRFNSSAWLAYHEQDYGPNRATQSGGNTFPLFSTDNGATPPIPSGWSILAGSHAGAIAFSAAAVGRKMTLSQSAGGGETIFRCNSANTAVAGDQCIASMYLTTTVKGTGGVCRFAFMNGGGSPLVDFGRVSAQGGAEDVSRSLLMVPFVHSGTTGILFDLVLDLGSGGASAVIEQFTINNLTAMGVA